MKRIFSLLLVAVILTACVPIVSASSQTTLVYSEGFETKDTSIFSGSMRKGYEYSTDYAKTGSVSLKAVGSEGQTGGWLWLKNTVTFEKGKTYSVRFFAMSESGSASVSAQLFIDGSTSVTSENASQAIPVGSWGEHVTHFTWNNDSTSAHILLKVGGESNIYIDDVEIYKGTYTKESTQEQDTAFKDIVAGSQAVNVYVDGTAADGGDGSESAPFNTIEAAQNYVRTINDNMTCDIVVNVKGGTYQITDTIVLTDEDSGTNGHYVIYQPYGYDTDNKEEVVLSGGKPVKGWTESEIDGVYSAPLEVDYLRNLYVNGKRAQRARYNEYVTPVSWWDDTENTLSKRDGFVIPGGIIKNPEKATNLEIYRTATFRSNWAVRGKAQANGDTTIIKMEQPYFYLHEAANYSVLEWKIENNFRLENALEFLDEPGEWYHDADTDTLYYMPRAGETMEDIDVIAPDTEKLLDIRGSGIDNRAENIIVRGLTFSHGAYKKTSRLGRANLQATTCYSIDAGGTGYQGSQYNTEGNINIINAKNVSLYDNVIKHMGAVAVAMPDGILNCEIKGNAIYDISSSAVTIGTSKHSYVTDNSIVPKNVLISNNVISDTGVEYESDPGIQGYYTNGLIISHNEVYDSTYSAICVGWGWTNAQDTKKNNIVEYNRIYNYGTACQDGGAIYTLGCQPNSVVRGNYIRSYEQDIVGIYHDEGSSGFTTIANVVDMPADSPSSGLYDHSLNDGLNISGNYTNVINSTANRANFCNNHTEQGSTRSADALEIRAEAGLESGFLALRNKIDGYSDNNANIQRIYLQTEEQEHQTPANIKVGETLTLKSFAEGRNGEITQLNAGLTYQVGNTSVLELNGNRITAISDGISNVTVTDANGHTAFMTVTVGDEVVSFRVLADKSSAKVDETINLIYRLKTKYTEYTGKPSKSSITSADTRIISVLSDGTVKAVGEGVGMVSVSVQCGEFTASGTATVVVSDNTYRTFKKLKLNSALTRETILSALGGAESPVIAEEDFADVLSAIIQCDSNEFYDDAGTATLTKEKMVAITVDALIEAYGVAPMGDSELYQYTDRADINPSLVPKIAMAYEYGLLSWLEVSSAFEPQKEMTAADAADFLYRFARPENFEYLRKDESRFSTYTSVAEWLITRNYPAKHAKSEQRSFEAVGEESVEIANTVHEGTDGVTIDDGKLVQKITRNTAYSAVSIVLLNGIDFKPGRSYTLTFSAKVSAVSGTSATNKNELSVEPRFSVAEGTGTISRQEISSDSWTDFSLDIKIPDDATYPITSNSIYIRLRNTSSSDTNCYDILFKDMVVTEASDLAILSSTIADGEENVMTPIDSVYLYASGAVDTTTVTADKFTITGAGSSIADVNVIDDYTICVGIDGCVSETDYTLTVSGIKSQSGGYLEDSISWTTAKAPSKKSGGWDFEASSKNGLSTDGSGVTAADISADYAHGGTHSLKLTTTTHGNMYVNHTGAGFDSLEKGKDYMISYWIYSPDKSMRTGMYKHQGSYRVISQTTISKGVWTKVSGVFSPTEDTHLANKLFIMEIFDNPGTCYIDDIEIRELQQNPVTVCRPNIFLNGIPVSRVDKGNIEVEIKIAGGAEDKEVFVVIAQYDDNNYMRKVMTSTDTVKAGEDTTVTINLPDAQNLKTKILVMGATSYEPYNDAIVMDKIVE